MARIQIEGLTKRYEREGPPALDGLSLELAQGELLVLVGPSGCGKSTALRLVAGLEEPDQGRVLLDGRDLVGVPPQERDVAMVFQGYALYPHLRVRDNIAFPLRMRSVPRAERERRVREAAELLGLGRLLDRRPAELSGGEQQRVAMARAIVRSPKVFLFDEPLSNLDAKLRAELRVELAALVRRLGTTAMYVTHDQAEAMTMGDRVAVVRKGRLEQVAPPREIYERPASAFVAAFLGTPTMNLLELRCADGMGSVDAVRIPLPAPLARRASVTVGMRPEHVRLGTAEGRLRAGVAATPSAAAGDVETAATVVAVEPLGAESFLHLDAGGTRLRARVAGLDAPAPGSSVTLLVDRAALHWFDTDSGERLDPSHGRPVEHDARAGARRTASP